MHPQLSPVAAQMRLDELSGRRQRPLGAARGPRTPWQIGRRRTAGHLPVSVIQPVAAIVTLPDCRACSESVREHSVA